MSKLNLDYKYIYKRLITISLWSYIWSAATGYYITRELTGNLEYQRCYWYVVLAYFTIFSLLEIFEYNIFWKSRSEISQLPSSYDSAFKENDKKSINEMEEEQKKLICIHEAGHAVIAVFENISFSKVYINTYGKSALEYSCKNYIMMTSKDYIKKALVAYGSLAAEKVFYDKIHAGCIGNSDADIESAEQDIRYSILLSEQFTHKIINHSDVTEQAAAMSEELYKKAIYIIEQNKDKVKAIADALMKQASLTERDVKKILFHDNLSVEEMMERYKEDARKILKNIQKELPRVEIGYCEMSHDMLPMDPYEWAKECRLKKIKIIGHCKDVIPYEYSKDSIFDIAICMEDKDGERFSYYYKMSMIKLMLQMYNIEK